MNLSDDQFIQARGILERRKAYWHARTSHAVYGLDDALMIGALGTSLAGTGLKIAGNEKAQSAINKTNREYAVKKAELNRQANQLFQDVAKKQTAPAVQQEAAKGAEARQQLTHKLQAASLVPLTPGQPITAANSTGNDAATRTATRSNAWSNLVGDAQARLSGYGDAEQQRARDMQRSSMDLGVVNNFARGNADVLPVELNAASHKGDALNAWGSLLGSIGNLGLNYGSLGTATNTLTPLSQVSNYSRTAAMLNGASTAARGSAAASNLAGGNLNLWTSLFAR